MPKKYFFTPLLLLLATFVVSLPREARAEALWRTAYYAGWMQGYLPPEEIDYAALTHVVHFSVVPKADGSLDSDTNSLTPAYSADLLSTAHAAGLRVLVSVGGEATATAFRGATSPTNLSRFVSNLVGFLTTRGYDGIDIDWEPLEASDGAQFSALVDALHSALGALAPRPLLTVAVAGQPGLVASLQDRFDQVNLMTYSLSGPWAGWVTWFDSPLYDGAYRFPSTGALVPSIDGMLNGFLSAGVASTKLGVGMSFYGQVWAGGSGASTGGVSAPRQAWSTGPTAYGLPYYSIMDNFSQAPYRAVWDSAAQAAYITLDDPVSSNDKFVSYDDETSVQSKVDYARAKGIGGVMIWELGGGYRPNLPAGERDPLLQAVKQAFGASAPNATATPLATPTPTPKPTATPAPTTTPLPTALPSPTPTTPSSPTPSPTPGSVGDLWLYRDALASPWVNASWSATVLFDALTTLLGSTRSIQVAEVAWGALSLHSGAWGATQAIDPVRYQRVELQVYCATTGFNVAVRLENDAKAAFPLVVVGTVPAGQWTTISVPMSQLDPLGLLFDRLDVSDYAGVNRTYLVDNVRFVAKAATATPTATPTMTPTMTPGQVPISV